jgi:internalin A
MDINLKRAKELIAECQLSRDPYLDLGNCGIKDIGDIPELFDCVHLETLILSSQWWDFENGGDVIMSKNSLDRNVDVDIEAISSEMERLKKLKKLVIKGGANNIKGIKNIEVIASLQNLEYLHISNNRFGDYDFLGKLSKLTSLYIGGNDISDCSFLASLTNLQELDLYDNKIKRIDFVSHLPNLTHLDLRDNYIQDYSCIMSPKLKALFIRGGAIRDCEFLRALVGLEQLSLYEATNVDVECLSKLSKLKYLDLGSCQITDVSHLKDLSELRELNLRDNKISSIDSLGCLDKITELNLYGNNLTDIPKFAFDLQMEVTLTDFERGLNLGGNPIQSPPIEIIKQGKKAIIDWFYATKDKLREIKVILIGDPKAGKTSLLRLLSSGVFNKDEPQTDGINIEHIAFGSAKTFEKQKSLHSLTGHFWDFGGQEIMNSTHRFFLTKRSVYVLVLDARKDANIATQIRHWVKRIIATGGNSSIVIVANQVDVNAGFGFSNEYELQNEFPQIKAFVKASCETKEGIDQIKDRLEELIPQAELFDTEIDERWIEIIKELEEETRTDHFLNETKFMEICKKHGLSDKEEQKNAINFLHDLGMVLHFEDLSLSEYYVLDPYWITYGVYQILTSKYVGEQKGIVGMDKLEYIINEEEDKKESYRSVNYKKLQYSTNERRFLVDILNQFKLCFYMNDGCDFIIPDLLETREPIAKTEPIRNATDSISFVYEYIYLPSSIIPNLMVQAHSLRILKERWRTGCVLESDSTLALVSAYENRISITVSGEFKKKREFMAVIRHLVDSISQNLTEKPKMLIPLTGINAFADYEVLLNRERKGRRNYIYNEDKPTEQEYEISKLLEGIPTYDEVKEISKKVDRLLANDELLKGNFEAVNRKLDGHFEYLINLPSSIEIKDQIVDAITELNNEQAEEIVKQMIILVSNAFELADVEVDEKLQKLYNDLKKSDNLEMKLKLGVPLINLIGIELETKYDIKKWLKEQYKKHEFKIFKLMGYIG